jgi:3-oxoacyl-[acyl-carrier protein] reductase
MRNVIVTGGSRGLGLGIARRLTREGYCVVAIARKETDQFKAAMQEVESHKSGLLRFVPFDLSVIEQIPELVRSIRKDFGPIYGLVNNAAVGFNGALALMHNTQIEQLVRLNTLAPIIMTKYVVRSMLADGGGRIVNVASIIGLTGYSGLSVYGATKASMIGFTRSLAREVGRKSVNVNSVAPGFLETEMTKELDEEQLQKIARRSALRSLATVDDVANAVEFLLSEKSQSITGTVLTVDAGNTA